MSDIDWFLHTEVNTSVFLTVLHKISDLCLRSNSYFDFIFLCKLAHSISITKKHSWVTHFPHTHKDRKRVGTFSGACVYFIRVLAIFSNKN